MKLVSIITVNYNQPIVTEALLKSIFAENNYNPIEIIVVDNGSVIDPVPAWKGQYPNVQFIRSEINLGFAGGNNLGISKASGDYLFLINNDTEVTASLVGILATTLDRNPKIGIVSPKIQYYDQPGMIQYAGYTAMHFLTGRNACIGQFEMDNAQYDSDPLPTGYAHGAAMMVRREALLQAGLMDEGYFLYYEELDWCERIRRKGFSIYIDPMALIYHKESVSVGRRTALKEFFMTRNRILFIRKNASSLQKIGFAFYFMLAVVPRNLLGYLRNREYTFIPVFLNAIVWNVTHQSNSQELGFPVNR